MQDEDYCCDLVGGPMDGQVFAFPGKPLYLYFPIMNEDINVTLVTEENFLDTPTRISRLMYKRVILGLYLYAGIEK